MKKLVIILLSFLAPCAWSGQYILNYQQWVSMTDEQKNSYVAGAVDTISTAMFYLAGNTGEVSEEQKEFSDCLRKSFLYTTALVNEVDNIYEVYFQKVEEENEEWVTPSYIVLLAVMNKCSFDQSPIEIEDMFK